MRSSPTPRDRFITVVPEIEMPGHALAAIAAYPELGVTGQPADVGMRWGVYANILNAENVDDFVHAGRAGRGDDALPEPFIHVGGDEADKALWKVDAAHSGAHPRARAQGRARAAELVHSADGRVPDEERAGASLAGTRFSRVASRRARR